MDLIRQIEDDWDDEKNCQISPAILNKSWTSESIQQWCKDRTKKYPTMAKAEKVELIRQYREERIARMRSEMRDNSERINRKRKKEGKFHPKKRQRVIRKYGEYEFPDCDYEDEEEKDGIFKFAGTKVHDKESLGIENSDSNTVALPISDSDNEEGESSCLDSTLSDKEECLESPRVSIESAKVMEYSYQANEEIDDDAPPQAVTIKKTSVQEQPDPKPVPRYRDKPQTSSSLFIDKPEKPRIEAIKDDKFNNEYLRILRKKKGQETFLEKLLENEIIRERHELLQCLHYVVTNNFFRE